MLDEFQKINPEIIVPPPIGGKVNWYESLPLIILPVVYATTFPHSDKTFTPQDVPIGVVVGVFVGVVVGVGFGVELIVVVGVGVGVLVGLTT